MNITTKQANNPISEVFHFDGYKQIRTMYRPEDDAVLFCGKDVAEALGYKNTRDALLKHCRRQVTLDLRQSANTVAICAGNPNAVFIPESDVYRLIMKSRLKAAEKFEEWVCQDVLPSIRRSGMYSKAVAESNLKPELQYALTVHIEEQTRRMLDELDRMDYFGTASEAAKKTIREAIAQRFNVPESLVAALQHNGINGIKKG
ncbi:Bro-N domain-containing protein [Aeromonas veronii]|uniref:BRO-N domain-containing protein n=1 Tax=Aeromonas veronii TaxID=654 RepID=UPI003BA2A1E5